MPPLTKLEKWFIHWKIGNKSIVIRGNHGIGKTYTCNTLVKKYNIHIHDIWLPDMEHININSIHCFHNEKIILIDNLDSQLEIDKKCVGVLKKIIQNTAVPIVVICSLEYNRKLLPILQLCEEYKLTRLSDPAILKIMKPIPVSDLHKRQLIKRSNGDMNFIKSQLTFECKTIILNKQTKKSISYNIFDTTKMILNDILSLEERERLFYMDYMTMGLHLHENYMKGFIDKQSPLDDDEDKNKSLNELSNYSTQLSDVDIMEKYMLTDETWDILPIIANMYTMGIGGKGRIQTPKYQTYRSKKYGKNHRMKPLYTSYNMMNTNKE